MNMIVVCSLALAALPAACATTQAAQQVQLVPIGRYQSGVFAAGGAEISAYHAKSKRLFVVNGATQDVEILDLTDPAAPTLFGKIQLADYGDGPTSVDVGNDLVAVAIPAANRTDPGLVVFFDVDGQPLGRVTVGALPDMLTFDRSGLTLAVANEGEPSDDYTVDPEGSVSIVDLSKGIGALTQADVRTADFKAFNGTTLPAGIRVFGPGASAAQDFEPEYITLSPRGDTAYVTLQENNALAIVDVDTAKVTQLVPFGLKDYRGGHGNELDTSDHDLSIEIHNAPVLGMYMPDGIDQFEIGGQRYLITANEGDARGYTGFDEEVRIKDLVLDPLVFPDASRLQGDDEIGRLAVTKANGDVDSDGDYDELWAFGARSVSIWDAQGQLVWDSGDMLERVTAHAYPAFFNSSNDDNNSFDTRSDAKGPEPEGVVVGKVGDRWYAFIGLERIGGVVVLDINDSQAPVFLQYINMRDFSGDPAAGTAGDLGPEGLTFVPLRQSPIDAPLLIVSNEISGSVAIFAVQTTP